MTDMPTLADVSTKLVELESHPGLEHLRRYAPTGVTAQRWSVIEAALGQLWEDLAGPKQLSDSDVIADCVERMYVAYREVKAFLDAVDDINVMVVKGIAPALKTFDMAGAAVPKEVTDLLSVSATDPLSLSADEIERRISEISRPCSAAGELACRGRGHRRVPRRFARSGDSGRRRLASAQPRRC